MIPAVDRSHLNSPYPLAELVKKGIKLVWFKAAQFTVGEDKAFNKSWQEAKGTPGLYRGAYYFFDPRFDGISQAKQFLSLGIDFKAHGCVGGCVDVEDLVVYTDGEEDEVLTNAANKWVLDNWQLAISRLTDFLNYFKKETGLDCVIYSYNGYMKEYMHSHPFPNNPFWLSSLQPKCPVRYDNGKLPEYWQNTYRWNDTDMDGDFFMGAQEELDKMANMQSVA